MRKKNKFKNGDKSILLGFGFLLNNPCWNLLPQMIVFQGNRTLRWFGHQQRSEPFLRGDDEWQSKSILCPFPLHALLMFPDLPDCDVALAFTRSWADISARLLCYKEPLVHPSHPELNNHTETVLIKSLLGPLAPASYWLTLTSYFNPSPLIH